MKKSILNLFKNNLVNENATKSIKGGYDGGSGWQYDGYYRLSAGGPIYYDAINPSTGQSMCGLTYDQLVALCM